jgi:hypothetical protein
MLDGQHLQPALQARDLLPELDCQGFQVFPLVGLQPGLEGFFLFLDPAQFVEQAVVVCLLPVELLLDGPQLQDLLLLGGQSLFRLLELGLAGLEIRLEQLDLLALLLQALDAEPLLLDLQEVIFAAAWVAGQAGGVAPLG